jgi:hypothetical protein
MLRGLRKACSRLPASMNERAQERLRSEIAEWAGGRYEDSNARTADQTGFDLAAFGYALPSLVTAP